MSTCSPKTIKVYCIQVIWKKGSDLIISIIIFFIIFGVLVISHEGGHFLIAKANGIRVNEFSVGMGPELFKKQKG